MSTRQEYETTHIRYVRQEVVKALLSKAKRKFYIIGCISGAVLTQLSYSVAHWLMQGR